MHSAGDGIHRLPCIVPRGGHEAAAASRTLRRGEAPTMHHFIHSYEICVLMFNSYKSTSGYDVVRVA